MRKIAVIAAGLTVLAVATGTRVALAAPQGQANSNMEKVVAQANEVKPADKEVTNEVKKPEPVMVTVNQGDSLSSIAEVKQTTWVRLYNANESVVNPDIINPGDQLRVPTAEEQLADRPLPQPVVASAPVHQTAYYAPAAPTYRASASTATSYPTDPNSAKAFIYSKESGNNPNATNPNGCYGLGQDCNGVLRAQCGADYACQDAYFDGYAQRRYGGWEGAQAFWNANGWW